jgi:hypothetical protein
LRKEELSMLGKGCAIAVLEPFYKVTKLST